MNKSKLLPYRLPASILVFFISYALLTRSALLYIASSTSLLISEFIPEYDALKEAPLIALLYALMLSVIGHFYLGKFAEVDAQENKKGLLKGLGLVMLIMLAYIYSLAQQ